MKGRMGRMKGYKGKMTDMGNFDMAKSYDDVSFSDLGNFGMARKHKQKITDTGSFKKTKLTKKMMRGKKRMTRKLQFGDLPTSPYDF